MKFQFSIGESARPLSRRAWLQSCAVLAGGTALTGRPISAPQATAGTRQFDVKGYGATGVRSQSATVPCQSAIDACAAAGGGTVNVPPGDYSVGMLGVSRTNTGRDVLRHWRRGAGGADLARGRFAPSTRGGQPIGVMRDVPVSQRRRMTAGGLIGVPTTGPGRRAWRVPVAAPHQDGRNPSSGRREARDRRADPDRARPPRRCRRTVARIGPAGPLPHGWRELARGTPECPCRQLG